MLGGSGEILSVSSQYVVSQPLPKCEKCRACTERVTWVTAFCECEERFEQGHGWGEYEWAEKRHDLSCGPSCDRQQELCQRWGQGNEIEHTALSYLEAPMKT